MSVYPSAKLIILCTNPDELIEIAKRELKGEWNIIRGSHYFVEFLMSGVSKGKGLIDLCEHFGYELKEVVAFGDGDNDKEFLEVAGWGVAMKNAGALAKHSANEVTEYTNDEDGVAIHLEKMEDLNLFA